MSSTAPTVVLLPSLGTTSRIWDGVVAALHRLEPDIRLIVLDLPGHGDAPPTTIPFSIDEIATAAIARVEESAATGPVVVAGVSLGGAIALEIARRQPPWLTAFAMFNSNSVFGDPATWTRFIAEVRSSGTVSLLADSASGWFTAAYRHQNPGEVFQFLDDLAAVDDTSFILCCEALAAFDRTAHLPDITVPALIVSGSEDTGPTPAAMQRLAVSLADARYVELTPAAHLGVVEHPDQTARLLIHCIMLPTHRLKGARQ